MKNLFLGTSFSGHVNYETGQVHDAYRREMEEVLDALRTIGNFTVFCAVEYEGWVIDPNIPAHIGVKKDLEQIDSSDVVVAVVPKEIISGGLQYEVGYADAKDKQVVLVTEQGSGLGYFNQGAVDLGRIQHIEYENPIH